MCGKSYCQGEGENKTMIELNQIKLPIHHNEQDLCVAIKKALHLKEEPFTYEIKKKSIDARKKEDIRYIYSILVSIKKEEAILKRCKKIKPGTIRIVKKETYHFPRGGTKALETPPVIVGTGPAGLFCGVMLARAGFRPILLERGECVENRQKTVEHFWSTRKLNPNSNVQFGEGGAGTFSDGKLNTLVKDKYCRNRKVLELFVEFGAPSEILYLNKPHIGTDLLVDIVKNLREEIISLGGQVLFETQLTDIRYENNSLCEIQLNHNRWMKCKQLILAIGHSARDTFSMLQKRQLQMEQKPFAIGLRIEHKAAMINEAQYGEAAKQLKAADYKLTHKAENGRNVYSFCMCPGGYVVNSSSEEGHIVVNGMSNYKRDYENSNSAIIVNVTPEDFFSKDPLAGVEFQRHWEALAYQKGDGKGAVPIQLFEDFKNNQVTKKLGDIYPSLKGQFAFSNLKECLPSYVADAIIDGVLHFEQNIKGFSRNDAVLSGVETRTSSPVRIVRSEALESNIKGIFPCGEGAGYAGGITSAAMDGLKIAEKIASEYAPFS